MGDGGVDVNRKAIKAAWEELDEILKKLAKLPMTKGTGHFAGLANNSMAFGTWREAQGFAQSIQQAAMPGGAILGGHQEIVMTLEQAIIRLMQASGNQELAEQRIREAAHRVQVSARTT